MTRLLPGELEASRREAERRGAGPGVHADWRSYLHGEEDLAFLVTARGIGEFRANMFLSAYGTARAFLKDSPAAVAVNVGRGDDQWFPAMVERWQKYLRGERPPARPDPLAEEWAHKRMAEKILKKYSRDDVDDEDDDD